MLHDVIMTSLMQSYVVIRIYLGSLVHGQSFLSLLCVLDLHVVINPLPEKLIHSGKLLLDTRSSSPETRVECEKKP